MGSAEFGLADFFGDVPVFDVVGRAPRVAADAGDRFDPFIDFRPGNRHFAEQVQGGAFRPLLTRQGCFRGVSGVKGSSRGVMCAGGGVAQAPATGKQL